MKEKLSLVLIIVFAVILNAENIMAQTKTIVAFGDSITAKRNGVIVYADLIKEEFDKKGVPINIINSGIGGNTSAMAKERFEKDVLAHKPDLVIIQFCTNDAAIDVWKNPPATKPRVAIDVYEKNIREFIKTLRKQKTKIIVIIPPPKVWTEKLIEMYGKPPFDPTKRDGFNISLRNYVAVLRKIVKSEKVPSVDVFEAFEKYDRVEGQKMENLLPDGLHPNTEGHQIIADLLLKELKKLKLGL